MKIAIVSNQNGQTGKSVLSLLLATTFSLTQSRRAAIFSTSECTSIYEQCTADRSQDKIKSTNVYKALMRNSVLDSEELYDYADRLGKLPAYVFNIFSNEDSNREEEEELFLHTLNSCNAEMCLVEVTGDLNSAFNKEVLNICDVILYVFNLNPKSMNAMAKYNKTFDASYVIRTGYICQMYNSDTLSEKRIAKETGIDEKNFMVIPYNIQIIKNCLNSKLDELAESIRIGRASVAGLRIKMLEIMQYLYDSENVKYIKGFEKW